mmetsp:Transcript_73657/g.173004  ORF Transcript_73657/g.173004 Transcript_73657/m.173004 type:complete len:202 (-) Transcript_73657:514-1119(-)
MEEGEDGEETGEGGEEHGRFNQHREREQGERGYESSVAEDDDTTCSRLNVQQPRQLDGTPLPRFDERRTDTMKQEDEGGVCVQNLRVIKSHVGQHSANLNGDLEPAAKATPSEYSEVSFVEIGTSGVHGDGGEDGKDVEENRDEEEDDRASEVRGLRSLHLSREGSEREEPRVQPYHPRCEYHPVGIAVPHPPHVRPTKHR